MKIKIGDRLQCKTLESKIVTVTQIHGHNVTTMTTAGNTHHITLWTLKNKFRKVS